MIGSRRIVRRGAAGAATLALLAGLLVSLAPSAAAAPASVTLSPVSTGFPNPIGIDYYQPDRVIMSVNWGSGLPNNFVLVAPDGTQSQFSSVAGLTDEVYLVAIRPSTCQGGFTPGDVFMGTGTPGVIDKLTNGGATRIDPWVTLPGEGGLLRGGIVQDTNCVAGGDLIVTTNFGDVWRVTSAGTPTLVATGAGDWLEGPATVPNNSRYGPWAGQILAASESCGCVQSIDPVTGAHTTWGVGQLNMSGPGVVQAEGVHIVPRNENFYGVDFGSHTLQGASYTQFSGIVGDVVVATESTGRLVDVAWDSTAGVFTTSDLLTANALQWEGTTFAPAGIPPIPPAPPPAPSISLAPLIQAVAGAVTATVTATVAFSAGNPAPGITVNFSVLSGPHAGVTGSGVTDASGQANFYLINDVTTAGTDAVNATFTDSFGTLHTSNGVVVVMRQPPNLLQGPNGGEGSFESPDFKVVRYIHGFDPVACRDDLRDHLPTSEAAASTACLALLDSANPVPPTSFTNRSWKEFFASKEYRAILHIPPLHVTCSAAGKITKFDQGRQVEKGLEKSFGYTPTPFGLFDPAEPYAGSLAGLFDELDITLTPSADAVIVQYVTGSRLSAAARQIGFSLLGYDAPFVWTVFREKVSCTGVNVVIVNSDFPSTNMYVDDQLWMDDLQTSNLADFIRSGGNVLHALGVGIFDPRCTMDEARMAGSPIVPLPAPTIAACARSILLENWPYA